MSLVNYVEQEVEKVFHDVETGVEDVDGAALAEARRLIALAKEAEAGAVAAVSEYKTEIAALLVKYGPEAVQLAEAEFEKLLSVIEGLFHLG